MTVLIPLGCVLLRFARVRFLVVCVCVWGGGGGGLIWFGFFFFRWGAGVVFCFACLFVVVGGVGEGSLK